MARREPGTPHGPADPSLDGLVLLDLPDHDSVRLENRLEMGRFVALVDQLIWVVDPEKYADAALHDGFLVPLAGYADVMLFVMNQIDRLSDEAVRACLRDFARSSSPMDSVGCRWWRRRLATAEESTSCGTASPSGSPKSGRRCGVSKRTSMTWSRPCGPRPPSGARPGHRTGRPAPASPSCSPMRRAGPP